MCSEALISECSSLHSCVLMHEPVLLTEVHTLCKFMLQCTCIAQSLDHTWVEQSKCLSSVRRSSSLVSCWTQDQARAGWHGFQSHLGQLIFIKNLSLIFSVNTSCRYLLEPVAFIPLYRNQNDIGMYIISQTPLWCNICKLHQSGVWETEVFSQKIH